MPFDITIVATCDPANDRREIDIWDLSYTSYAWLRYLREPTPAQVGNSGLARQLKCNFSVCKGITRIAIELHVGFENWIVSIGMQHDLGSLWTNSSLEFTVPFHSKNDASDLDEMGAGVTEFRTCAGKQSPLKQHITLA